MIAAGRGAIPHFTGTVEEGLPALRRDWILQRGDVEEYAGRDVQPMDDGYLSGKHRGLDRAKRQDETALRLEGLDQRRAAKRCAPSRAKWSPNSPTPAPASSRRKWNSSPSART